MISKILLKSFQINLILEFFMCLMLELLNFLLVFYSLGVTFFFVICDFNFLTMFYVYIVFEFALFFSFFSQQKLPS